MSNELFDNIPESPAPRLMVARRKLNDALAELHRIEDECCETGIPEDHARRTVREASLELLAAEREAMG